jgi:hypothetical protein
MEEREEPEGLPIPKVFLNSDTGAPLSHCIQCDYNVLEGDRHYMIEKIFKKYLTLETTQVLFEYAICSNCYEEMKKGLSQESMTNLSAYMMTNTDFASLQQRMSEHPDDPEAWLTHCMIKGSAVSDLTEYQVGASFKGDRLVTNMMPPFMIGNVAMEEMNELLSKETKDEMDGFMDKNFGIPPELRKDLVLI